MDPHKQLAQFVSFHLHPHSPGYNAIEGIVSVNAIGNQVKDLLELLNKDFVEIDYRDSDDAESFLTGLAENLSSGKIVVINLKNPKFDPVVFDQLIKLKETNSFDLLTKSKDLSSVKIPQDAKIFMLSLNEHTQLEEISDHLFDLRKVN